MSESMFRNSYAAVRTANKILAFLLLEGIEHVDIDVTYNQVQVVAFVHDMPLVEEVRSIMRFGNYVGATYEEKEYLTAPNPYMMCQTTLPFKNE